MAGGGMIAFAEGSKKAVTYDENPFKDNPYPIREDISKEKPVTPTDKAKKKAESATPKAKDMYSEYDESMKAAQEGAFSDTKKQLVEREKALPTLQAEADKSIATRVADMRQTNKDLGIKDEHTKKLRDSFEQQIASSAEESKEEAKLRKAQAWAVFGSTPGPLLKVGLHANYIFKGDQISMAAAVQQSAIQKKSAFSPVVGFEVYRLQVQADSLVVPAQLSPKQNFQRADFLQLGPNAGMIGTLVFGKGFFATGSFTGNLGLGTAWNQDPLGEQGNWKLGWGYHARAYLGYNGPRFGMNVNYIHKNLILPTFGNLTQEVYTGNYRFVLVYKIRPAQKFATSFGKYNPLRIFRK
jgi:hypothetical protein